jgi:hypothetical protein
LEARSDGDEGLSGSDLRGFSFYCIAIGVEALLAPLSLNPKISSQSISTVPLSRAICGFVIFYLGIYSQSPNIPQEHPKDTFETRDGDEFSNISSSPVASISMNGEERLNKKICMLPSTTAHPFTQ